MSHWFIYDFYNSVNGKCWRGGSSKEMPSDEIRGLGDELRKREIAKNENPEKWEAGDFIAGIKKTENFVAVFRIFYGGWDPQKRPNRWVMLLAEGSREEFAGTDILTAVESREFQEFSKTAKGETVKPPETGEIPCVGDDAYTPVESGKNKIEGEEVIREKSLAFTRDNSAFGLLLVKKRGNDLSAETDFYRTPSSAPKPAVHPVKFSSQKSGDFKWKTMVAIVSLAFLVGLLIPMYFLKAKCDEFEQDKAKNAVLIERRINSLQRQIADLKEDKEKLKANLKSKTVECAKRVQELNEANREIARLKGLTREELEWFAQQMLSPVSVQMKDLLKNFESQILGRELEENEYKFGDVMLGENYIPERKYPRPCLKNLSGQPWRKIKLVVRANDGQVWILEYPKEIGPNMSIEFPKDSERTVQVWVLR